MQSSRPACCAPPDHDDHDGRRPRGLPLALGRGTGSELRHPLGIAIVGGLIFSQMLTLYTTRWFTSISIVSAYTPSASSAAPS